MGNPVIGTPLLGDAAEITASIERTGFPVTNLQRMDPSDRWEVDDLSGIFSVNLDFGDVAAFSLLGLLHHNASAYGGFRLRAALNSVGEIITSPVSDSAPLGPYVRTQNSAPNVGTATDGSWTQTDFTLELWIEPDHSAAHGVISRTGTGDNAIVRINYLGQIEVVKAAAVILTSTTTVQANYWTHIAVSYDSGTTTASLIVNGVLEDSDASVASWSTGTTITASPLDVEYFSGNINCVRYWSDARTPAEVLANLAVQMDGTEANLLGQWVNEEGTGSTCGNSVGGGVDLVFSAGSSAVVWGYPHPLRSTTDQEFLDWRYGFLHVPLGIAARYVQVDFLDPLNADPDGVFRMGRLFLSSALQFSRNILRGSDLAGWRDESRVFRSDLGTLATVTQTPKRDLRVKFLSTELWDMSALEQMFYERGGSKDLIYIRQPDASDRVEQQVIHGILSSEFRVSEDWASHYTGTLRIREL